MDHSNVSSDVIDTPPSGNQLKPFEDPYVTADGSERARVKLSQPTTLWFNTGTLCNIACKNCYIYSTPTNDSLVYISSEDVSQYLRELRERQWPIKEIAFTGGEPFMNPFIIDIVRLCLFDGYHVLVLTNAMRPMMRPHIQKGLMELNQLFGDLLRIRVSLDHYTEERHDEQRGKNAFSTTLVGMDWLQENGLNMSVAGRTMWGEAEDLCRDGFARLFKVRNYMIDAYDPEATVLFPEINPEKENVPEITKACWDILGVRPQDMMCASSRMVVKRKGAPSPTVVACTLLPDDPQFDLGPKLKDAEADIYLNHTSCAQFCVLGGASCSRG